ncbi:hexosaminidase D [Ctenocephalides felis]|uniref:hexosaminidase D n=1 Tax=Ctenocephalides felis TaxID=7515 RepID=UPI000E6E5569|nr:hexosaminidase D [Ctenocephalides felis]
MGLGFATELIDSSGAPIAAPPRRILIHFDLKGAPPKPGYIKRVMLVAKSLGATGVLMEYEDMAPFTGRLANIAAGNAYTKDDIKEILKAAKESNLNVIPLVQTFGHLEFALKIKDFKHLREVPDSPQALCPSLNESLTLVEDLITQMMELHEGTEITHLHIGCDEVFQMGECPRCRNIPRDDLFISHVLAVAQIVRRRWPGVRPIIWDDMLRHIDVHVLRESGLGKVVDPMVWVYAPDVYRFVSPQIWEKYAAVFSTAWTAPAFKGAHGETLVVPPARKHLENTVRWLSVMAAEGSRFEHGLSGIVLTGWQRYDHFAVLCELLPSAVPVMAMCLAICSKGRVDKEALDAVNTALTCPEPSGGSDSHRHWIDLNSDPNLYSAFSRCLFPGHQFFKLIQRLEMAHSETQTFLETTKVNRAWMTDYNIRRNYSAPLRIDELMADSSHILASLTSVARSAPNAMEDIFDDFTIAEWVEQKVYPMIKQVEDLEESAKQMRDVNVWAKRPLPKLKDLSRFGIPRVNQALT